MSKFDALLIVGLIVAVVGLALITPALGLTGAGLALVLVWLVAEVDG